jgi:hypothetical protein
MAPTWFTLNYLIRPALRVKRWPVGEKKHEQDYRTRQQPGAVFRCHVLGVYVCPERLRPSRDADLPSRICSGLD